MRNVLLLQLETKVALAIILIVVVVFLITIFKSIDNFNKFIGQSDAEKSKYEEVRLQENP